MGPANAGPVGSWDASALLRPSPGEGILRPMSSTRDLSALQDLPGTRRLLQSLAVLDAVMSPQWESRYYMFDAAWGHRERSASMRDGCGDHWHAILCAQGMALVGLAHEAPAYVPGQPHPGLFADLPEAFHANLLHEPAFETSDATFCIWRMLEDDRWHAGADLPEGDGSAGLLTILEGRAQDYAAYAAEYFEQEVSLADVQWVYAHRPLTPEVVARLNPEADFAELEAELAEIGYPAGAV